MRFGINTQSECTHHKVVGLRQHDLCGVSYFVWQYGAHVLRCSMDLCLQVYNSHNKSMGCVEVNAQSCLHSCTEQDYNADNTTSESSR